MVKCLKALCGTGFSRTDSVATSKNTWKSIYPIPDVKWLLISVINMNLMFWKLLLLTILASDIGTALFIQAVYKLQTSLRTFEYRTLFSLLETTCELYIVSRIPAHTNLYSIRLSVSIMFSQWQYVATNSISLYLKIRSNKWSRQSVIYI